MSLKRTIIKIPVVIFLITGLTSWAQAKKNLPPFDPSKFSHTLKGLPQKRLIRVLDSVSQLYSARNPEEGIRFLDFAIRQMELKGIEKKTFAPFYLRRGQKYSEIKKYALSLNDLLKAEELYLKTNNLSGLQQVFTSSANLYVRSGQNPQAIKYALKAKKYAEQLGESESIGVIYNTLANLYKDQQMNDSAMHYYQASLQLLRKKKNHVQEALLLDNISMLWGSMKQDDSAAYYNLRALEIARANKDTYLELQLMLNNSSILEKKGDFNRQYSSAVKAKHLADSIGIYPYQVYTELNVAAALMNLKQPAKAIELYRHNISPLLSFGDNSAVALCYEEMSKGFETMKNSDSAFYYYKLWRTQADSVKKISDREQVNELLAREQLQVQEEKIENLNQLNKTSEEKNAALAEKNTLKTAIIWISVALLAVIAVLLVITIKRFNDNKKLTQLLGHKNTEITDSINYAQRIQFALLPDQREMNQLLDAFVLFMPKDIVSGDFYWVTQKDNLVFIAVGDCTGHGVPGGFMSMLGHSFLNDVIIDKHIHDPGKILDTLREKVIASLKQTGATGENKDGMDIGLAVLDKANGLITYAAANNPLYFYHQGKIQELGADKQPIGFYSQVMKPFTTQKLPYTKGDRLYLFTDGYADQFGGPKGKKLLYKRMKTWVEETAHLQPQQQYEELAQRFKTWTGTYDQVDDVCLVGIFL